MAGRLFPASPSGAKTAVAGDAEAERIEHPLQRRWTLWFDEPASFGRSHAARYEEGLKKLGTFGTVEEFWRLLDHVVLPSKMPQHSNYHCFLEGVQPMWEDPYNRTGGKWVITFKPGTQIFDAVWARTLAGIVGETVNVDSSVCGIVASRRAKGDRISVWTKNKDDTKTNMQIGQMVLVKLEGYSRDVEMDFNHHDDSLRAGLSFGVRKHLTKHDLLGGEGGGGDGGGRIRGVGGGGGGVVVGGAGGGGEAAGGVRVEVGRGERNVRGGGGGEGGGRKGKKGF